MPSTLAKMTTLKLIWERMKHNAITASLDERTRNGLCRKVQPAPPAAI
jgi:hypothetical protein